jgi:hypothetical protein
MIVWLDDIRNPIDYGYEDAFWCKNLKQFYTIMDIYNLTKSDDVVSEIHFDNDLGGDEEGYTAFVWLEKELFDGNFKNLKNIYVHTSNPSAAKKFMVAKDLFTDMGINIIRKNY